MTPDYYILKDRQVQVARDVLEWGEYFQKNDRIIKQETTRLGYWVSTVFLGVDYNFKNEGEPILFETMVFDKKGKSEERDQERYTSYAQAELGHDLMVRKWSNRNLILRLRLRRWAAWKLLRLQMWALKIKNKLKRKKSDESE